MEKLLGSICIDDIPVSKIQTGKDGKRYVKVAVVERKEARQSGNYTETHFIAASLKKDEKLPEGEKRYFGGLGHFEDNF